MSGQITSELLTLFSKELVFFFLMLLFILDLL